ncbi:MAG TPA: dicarboxylate/amino acid:cation symporter [Smithella sp.]|nr:dicarboxylate/amino acid:cation symporter [Smithella sp.]HOG90347.1 dicarboxylate/amino acid:cation symporter [Smithella sp.]HOU50026.1 dicarboxylate/amino acid:cation symporter [Smithella sp.]HQG64972.1 dicarboxylate/amino acid:cation symporter [Smithella sp.]HQH15960.1 dicarboxylate/amino acid:cation symporter [Smithella sp.]
MQIKLPPFLKSYGFSIILMISIIIGSILGFIYKKDAVIFKPLGDIFLNLLFTVIVPLVFFSISAAVASMTNIRRLGKIMGAMIFVFVVTGLIASMIMIIGVMLYPPAEGVKIALGVGVNHEQIKLSEQIVKAFTVSDFADLISKKNMLALIIFSILIGLATSASGERGKPFAGFLASGSDVMMKLISYIMYYAPVGLCAYFAYLVGVFGPQLLGAYMKAMMLYYPAAFLYFFIAFTLYVFIAAKKEGVIRFWRNIIPPALIALGTGSSMATIPANLEAADKTGVPRDISEVVIPIGATMHMEGSCLAAVVKIAFLFGIFQMNFFGLETIATAIGISLLVGVVVSGIPGGGTIGELLIISIYGFPLEAFPIITMIGTLVDAPATMLNAVGDNVSSMIVSRILGGKNWLAEK